MKQRQSKSSNNKINQWAVRLLSILLRRLESLGLYSNLKIHTSLRRRSSMVGSLSVFIFAFAFLFPLLLPSNDSVYATSSSLNMTMDTSSAILSLLPTSSNGNFASSNDITVSVKTTNYTGYKLSIMASSSTNLVNSSENTNLTTIGSAITEDTFSSSSSYNNMWGYKPSKYYDSTSTEFVTNTGDNAVYLPSPNTSTGDIIDETSVANTTNNNYTISIGARADLTTKVGAYTNTFVLTAIANAIPYTITYNMNGGSNGPANENTATYASSVNISSTVPAKTNYTFLGWCAGTSSSSNITTTAGVDSCSSTIYNPNGGGTNLSLNIDQTSSSNDTYLYAMWSLTSYTVTVNFAGSGVASVSFTNATYGNATTVSTSGGTTSLKHGVTYTITMNFSSSSYTINSWATTANGTLGSTSANPTTYTVTNTATLTATGKSKGYTITYKANGGTGSDYTQTISGTDYLNGNNFTRSNYYFKGWSTSSGTNNTVTYRAGQSITPTGNMTLYAVWGSSTSTTLYNIVASLNYSRTLDNTTTNGTGLSAKAGIKASTITKDNSGVFTYNPTTFGTSSDAANTSTIYLYRGILDSNLGSIGNTRYGSYGNSANYPNYVKLGNTCWRIVRTTGSGGVKMVYNGLYSGGTTNNSCANATDNAQVTTSAFNGDSSTFQQIVRVGYTYNSTYATNTAQSGTIAEIFGTNSTPSVNNTRSTIKEYIEDTWYASNMTAYTSILEPSAGYCNDRTMNTTTSWTTPLAESSTIAATYGTSSLQYYYFGAYIRNATTSQKPSLTCAKYSNVDRSTVDLYRYVANSTGVSNELKYPVALLTADEASFAGSGNSTATNGSAYNANSFLCSGSYFWLLSPNHRNSGGSAYEFFLYSNGDLGNIQVRGSYGVRPAISLASGTTAASGSGTATDPWVVTAP